MSSDPTSQPQPETATVEDLPAGAVEIAGLAQKLAEAEDRHLRLYAEFENYRKRTARENEEVRKYAGESLLKELLPVVDSLEKAVAHAGTDDRTALGEGVELVLKQFMDTLARFDVQPIPALGEKFNPAVHQAVSQVETDTVPDGAVAEEYRRGYFYKERVLRPAMVVVARGSGK